MSRWKVSVPWWSRLLVVPVIGVARAGILASVQVTAQEVVSRATPIVTAFDSGPLYAVFGVDGDVIRVRRVAYTVVHDDGTITPWIVNGVGLPVDATAIGSFIHVNRGDMPGHDGVTPTIRYLEMLDATMID